MEVLRHQEERRRRRAETSTGEPPERSVARSVLRAAIAGAIAAMAMTGLRELNKDVGLVREEPPDEVLSRGAPWLAGRLSEEQRDALAQVAHLSYGALGGAAYRLLPERIRKHRRAGAAYGLLLWVVFEGAIAPLLGLRRAYERPGKERAAFLVDHVMYGSILAQNARD